MPGAKTEVGMINSVYDSVMLIPKYPPTLFLVEWARGGSEFGYCKIVTSFSHFKFGIPVSSAIKL